MWRLLLAVNALIAIVGCDQLSKTCTQIGCGAAFQVELEPASGWRPGSYRFEVDADGVKASCTVRLPFASCQAAAACEGQRDWGLILSGCALPPGNHSLPGLTFDRARPASVQVAVFHEGRPIGSGTFMPSYVVSHPNGRDCGPECQTAPPVSLTLE